MLSCCRDCAPSWGQGGVHLGVAEDRRPFAEGELFVLRDGAGLVVKRVGPPCRPALGLPTPHAPHRRCARDIHTPLQRVIFETVQADATRTNGKRTKCPLAPDALARPLVPPAKDTTMRNWTVKLYGPGNAGSPAPDP